jgi:hypothetical protein
MPSDLIFGIVIGIIGVVFLTFLWKQIKKTTQDSKCQKEIKFPKRVLLVAAIVLIMGYLFDTGTTAYVAITNPSVFLTSECNCGATQNFKMFGVTGLLIPDIGSYIMFYIAFFVSLRFLFKKNMWGTSFVFMAFVLGLLHAIAGFSNATGIVLGAYDVQTTVKLVRLLTCI